MAKEVNGVSVHGCEPGRAQRWPRSVSGSSKADSDLGWIDRWIQPDYQQAHVGSDCVSKVEISAQGKPDVALGGIEMIDSVDQRESRPLNDSGEKFLCPQRERSPPKRIAIKPCVVFITKEESKKYKPARSDYSMKIPERCGNVTAVNVDVTLVCPHRTNWLSGERQSSQIGLNAIVVWRSVRSESQHCGSAIDRNCVLRQHREVPARATAEVNHGTHREFRSGRKRLGVV